MSILGPSASTAVFHKRWREIQADPGGLRAVPVALAASVTIEPLVPYLGAFLAERGLHARFTIAPFNQIYQGLLDPESDLRRADAAVTVVLPRLEELCSRSLERLALLDPGQAEEARAEAHAEIGRLVEALSGYERATRGMLLCGTLPPPATTPLGVLDASHPASVHALQRELNVALWRSASRSARLRLVDVDALVAHLGGERAWDPRMALVGGCPYSAAFLRLLGERLARSIAPLFRAPAKVVVLDLDNTLWGGIVGEDGPGGLALGGSGVGAGYVAFQEALLALRAQGVLLCVASKNNPDDAHEVLDRHPGMRIRRQHLSAERISWEPKSAALRQLSEELGLGLDSFVFVDDSPAECEEIRRLLPEVSVLQLPPDPARFVEALRAVPALDRMVLTGEDRMRADLYAAERERSAARPADAADPEAMARHLRSLQLRARVRRLGAEDLPRAAQLTQKTNQFNLTTIRRTEAELAALRAEDGWRLYGLDVADRFGDYGFTGLALARRTADDTWDLDTVLLSCRVLGRGVETALLAAIVRDLAGAGARRLTGRFVPTAKNAPARDFLARHGFAEGEGGRWTREPLPGPPLGAAHVAVTFEG
jgi:FkbH-like protein